MRRCSPCQGFSLGCGLRLALHADGTAISRKSRLAATLEKVSGHYISDDMRRRADDVVWRVQVGGQWVYLYLLIEFQSTIDRHMALRMMVYTGLLYQDLLKRNEVLADGLLPPVLPIVLYNGGPRWTAPTLSRRSRYTMVFPQVQDLKELNMALSEKIVEWAEGYKQEGRHQGEALALLRLLAKRFGGPGAVVRQRIDTANLAQIEIWFDRAIEAQSLSQVFDEPPGTK